MYGEATLEQSRAESAIRFSRIGWRGCEQRRYSLTLAVSEPSSRSQFRAALCAG